MYFESISLVVLLRGKVQCINERIIILNDVRKDTTAKRPSERRRLLPVDLTDKGEIMIIWSVILVMS